MPVSVFLCEGASKSPDVRLLAVLLSGVCGYVRPSESKYGLGERIKAFNETASNSVSLGLRDRDFDKDNSQPQNEPRPWKVDGGKRHLGWYWERKEIENYLIDPKVVYKALGEKAPPDNEYIASLEKSAVSIAEYTAARTALSICRVRFSPLGSSWGYKRGKDDHLFPDVRLEAACRNGIMEVVNKHTNLQSVDEQVILSHFDQLLVECRLGGIRFKDFMTFFAGKDLLCAMESDLKGWGYPSYASFRERILRGIEQSQDDVWTWLTEWKSLREQVQKINIA